MGTTVTGTLRIGDEDLCVISPLGGGTALVHRQDPDEGAPNSHDHHSLRSRFSMA